MSNLKEFDYKSYWNERLNSNFSIDSAGYMGMGKIYNIYMYKNRLDMLEKILHKKFRNIEDISVLELGPGIGIFTEFFKNKGITNYYGIDISMKSVNELTNRFKDYKFVKGDICDYYNYKGKYDIVLAADVLLNLTNEDKYKDTLKNISNSLEEKGIAILYEPITYTGAKSTCQYEVIRDRKYIKEVLQINGLEEIDTLPLYFFMNYPFDNKLLGNEDKQNTALKTFDLIIKMFSSGKIKNQSKVVLGEYLLNKDRYLLMKNNFGLSEKVMLIKKKSNKIKDEKIFLNEIYDLNKCKQKIEEISEILKNNLSLTNGYFLILDKMINNLLN